MPCLCNQCLLATARIESSMLVLQSVNFRASLRGLFQMILIMTTLGSGCVFVQGTSLRHMAIVVLHTTHTLYNPFSSVLLKRTPLISVNLLGCILFTVNYLAKQAHQSLGVFKS